MIPNMPNGNGGEHLMSLALREAREEIGLDPRFVSIVGYLPDHVLLSGFHVTPVVGFVRSGFELQLASKEVQDTFDAPAMTAVWDAALRAPAWDRSPVWFHGDLHLGNLLISGGHLSAVIDFAGLGAGDPACDLVIAWNLLSPETRPVFRAALQVDDATWTRAQGWALATGLNAYTAYAATDPLVAMNTRRQISHVLIDHARTT